MKPTTRLMLALATASLLPMAPAHAKVPAAEAARLGKDLTAVGAVAAGNREGSIPQWAGASVFDESVRQQTPQSLEALRQQFEILRNKSPQDFAGLIGSLEGLSPASYPAVARQLALIESKLPAQTRELARHMREQMGGASGQYENPLFTIEHGNLAQYKEQLTAGQRAMFAKYADYRMVVYPALRSAYYPDEINQATIRNATSAELTGTDDISGAVLGFPFPIPKTGAEVIWNHKMAYRGSAVRRYNNQAIVKSDGSYQITKVLEDLKFKYANIKDRNPGGKVLFYYLSNVLSPPRVAGSLLLIHEGSGINGGGRDAWLYSAGLGRVNRAPDVGYDNPAAGSDGEQFNDQIDVYNGALDRYDWKLLGKKEVYIPYNSFFLISPLVKYRDIIRPGHINQNLLRYELHRVWVVEANLKAGLRHQFKRRTFYVDEDGWSIAAVDCYDNRDQLWKVQESELVTVPFVPLQTGVAEVIYDLQSGRYFVTALQNEDKFVDFKIDFKDQYFSPGDLNHKAQVE